MKRLITLLIMMFFIALSCTKLEDLSQDVEIKSFEITSSSPSEIILGEPSITMDTVYIPIEYGKYEFPLTIYADIETTLGNEMIQGINIGSPIIFDNIDSRVDFVITSESGYSRKYTLKPEASSLNEDVMLFDEISISEADTIFTQMLPTGDSTYNIVVFDGEFPMTLTPTLEVAPKSTITRYAVVQGSTIGEFEEYSNSKSQFTYSDSDTRYIVEVEAESGKTQEWTIGVESIQVLPVAPTTEINYKELTARASTPNLSVSRTDIDVDRGIVSILVDTTEMANQNYFPIEVDVMVPANELNTLVGVNDNMFSHSYSSWSDTVSYVVFDVAGRAASRWRFAVEPYAEEKQYTIEKVTITKFTTGEYIGRENLVSSSLPPAINQEIREVTIFYTSYFVPTLPMAANWDATFECSIESTDGSTATPTTFVWESKKGEGLFGTTNADNIHAEVKSVKTLTLTLPDGSTQSWGVRLAPENLEASSLSKIQSIDILGATPNYTTFSEPDVVISDADSTIQFNLGSRYKFPLTIEADFTVSTNATISIPQGLYFENEDSEVEIIVTSHDTTSTTKYTARLTVPEVIESSDITSITFGDIPQGVSLIDSSIDSENSTMVLKIECDNSKFPLTLPITDYMLSDGAVLVEPLESVTFGSPIDIPVILVQSPSQTRRKWYFRIEYYQQIENSDLNHWSGDYIDEPWASANMETLVTVINTVPVMGVSGQSGDYAAQMVTGSTFDKLASGTLFTGWFDSKNAASSGLSDPTVLTWFGVPFSPSVEIKGIKFDISYSSAESAEDWGSASVELINWNGAGVYEYHGSRPINDDPKDGVELHPNNTAVSVSRSSIIVGNNEGSTTYGDPVDLVLPRGEWREEVVIPINGDVSYTHIAITFASSAYGDYFIGQRGSTMRIDNIEIVY